MFNPTTRGSGGWIMSFGVDFAGIMASGLGRLPGRCNYPGGSCATVHRVSIAVSIAESLLQTPSSSLYYGEEDSAPFRN